MAIRTEPVFTRESRENNLDFEMEATVIVFRNNVTKKITAATTLRDLTLKTRESGTLLQDRSTVLSILKDLCGKRSLNRREGCHLSKQIEKQPERQELNDRCARCILAAFEIV